MLIMTTRRILPVVIFRVIATVLPILLLEHGCVASSSSSAAAAVATTTTTTTTILYTRPNNHPVTAFYSGVSYRHPRRIRDRRSQQQPEQRRRQPCQHQHSVVVPLTEQEYRDRYAFHRKRRRHSNGIMCFMSVKNDFENSTSLSASSARNSRSSETTSVVSTTTTLMDGKSNNDDIILHSLKATTIAPPSIELTTEGRKDGNKDNDNGETQTMPDVPNNQQLLEESVPPEVSLSLSKSTASMPSDEEEKEDDTVDTDVDVNGMRRSFPVVSQAVVLLNVVAVLWGTQHAIIKLVVDDTGDPGLFTLIRFGVAALFAGAATPLPPLQALRSESSSSSTSNNIDPNTNTNTYKADNGLDWESFRTVWRWGAEMGVWMFLGFAFQAIGLETTTAQRSGFLLYLNVKFVPFFARILLGRDISLVTWISAITAFAGTALLATANTAAVVATKATTLSTSTFLNLNVGDWWSIAAAAASAMFILRLESASTEVERAFNNKRSNADVAVAATDITVGTIVDPSRANEVVQGDSVIDITASEAAAAGGSGGAAALNSACLWIVAFLAGIWTIVQHQENQMDVDTFLHDVYTIVSTHGWELVYLSGVTTAFANWIQTKAQREISAERASVIYAMDPVYGAAFSNLLLGETLGGILGWIGAGLITLAAATNAFLVQSSSSTDSSPESNVNSRPK